jgi:hypothetical protein
MKKIIILLLSLVFSICIFGFENQYRIPNKIDYYTPFAEIESEPVRNAMRTRAVSKVNWFYGIGSIFGYKPRNGDYILNTQGQWMKITDDDYKHYLTDDEYRSFIDNGGVDTYENFIFKTPSGEPIGQLTPLYDDLLMLFGVGEYILYKYYIKKHKIS